MTQGAKREPRLTRLFKHRTRPTCGPGEPPGVLVPSAQHPTPNTQHPAPAARRATLIPLVALGFVLLASGCAKKSVATINGEAITRDEFYERTLSYTRAQPNMAAGMQILDGMITERLWLQEAKRENVLPTDAEVDQQVNEARTRMQAAGANLEQQLQQAGLTLDAIRHDIRLSLAQEKLLTKGITVTDQDVEKFYNENKAAVFSTPAQVHLRHLTVDSEKKAQEAHKDLKNADFGLVAQSRSIDMFKDRGGDVGPIPRDIQPGSPIAPAVINKAFSMKKGELSPPIKVGNNWVIIKVQDVLPAKTQSLNEVRDDIRRNLLMQKAQTGGNQDRLQQRMMSLRQQADIQVQIEQYKNAPAFQKQPAPGVPGAGALPSAPPGPPAGGPPPAGAPPAGGG